MLHPAGHGQLTAVTGHCLINDSQSFSVAVNDSTTERCKVVLHNMLCCVPFKAGPLTKAAVIAFLLASPATQKSHLCQQLSQAACLKVQIPKIAYNTFTLGNG